jgi:itaconyl-CoA hydratase
MSRTLSSLTSSGTYFEDFTVGDRFRHTRGKTVDAFENQVLTHLVMNTAQAHFNEHAMAGTNFGGRLVFGLVTGSIVIGLTMQDTAENGLCELGLDELRFTAPVFHGDSLYAFTEVLETRDDATREDAGVVVFKHWGLNQKDQVVFEGKRRVLVKRRSHWGER